MNIEKKIKKVLNNNGVTTKATDENMWVIRVNKKLIKELSQLLQESGEVEYERGVAHGKLQEALLQEGPIPETYISDTTEYPTNKEAKE